MLEDLSLEDSVMGEKIQWQGRRILKHYYKKTMKNKHENVFFKWKEEVALKLKANTDYYAYEGF